MLLNKDLLVKKEEDISFTQKCILFSSISKDKSKMLITSFYDLPLVKLYTSEINSKNLIYSKVKGVLCFLQDKTNEQNSRKFYFRIYSINTYSLLFNIELNKEDLQYYIKIRDLLYCLQTQDCLLGFLFNSKEKSEKFYLQLRDEPNKEILNQNEKAFNLDSSKLNNSIYKDIIDSIKEELTKNNKKKGNKLNAKTNNYIKGNEATKVLINDIEGEYLDFSYLYFIYVLMNNVEFDEEDNKLDFFETNKLDKNMCQNIINQFNTNKIYNFPMQIITKDFNNILNKKKYINYMTNNIIETIKQKSVLVEYKNESTRQKQKQIEEENKMGCDSARAMSIIPRKINSALKYVNKPKNCSTERRKVQNRNVTIKERVTADSTERKTIRDAKKFAPSTRNINYNKTMKTDNPSNSNNVKFAKTIRFADKNKPNNKAKANANSEKKKGGAFLGGIFKKKK
jgi:hypothetical protein